MSDIVTQLVAEKHRMIRERDVLDQKIAAVNTTIVLLQDIQTPVDEGTAGRGEGAQEGSPFASPASHQVEEKAATFPDAPPPQPEAVQPCAPPAAPTLGQSDHERRNPPWATEARCHILRTHYPKKARTSREIMRLLEASPGPRTPDWGNIGRYAQDVLGLAPINRSHAQTASKKDAAIPIAYNDLIAKAAEWGITEINADDLLAAVNTKAARIGHKPYALQSRST